MTPQTHNVCSKLSNITLSLLLIRNALLFLQTFFKFLYNCILTRRTIVEMVLIYLHCNIATRCFKPLDTFQLSHPSHLVDLSLLLDWWWPVQIQSEDEWWRVRLWRLRMRVGRLTESTENHKLSLSWAFLIVLLTAKLMSWIRPPTHITILSAFYCEPSLLFVGSTHQTFPEEWWHIISRENVWTEHQ